MKSLWRGFFSELKTVIMLALLVAVPVCIFLFHVWNQFRITETGYEIAAVTNTHRALLEENRKLSIEAAIFGRTERMAAMAREQFGLERVEPHQVVTIQLKGQPVSKSELALAETPLSQVDM